MTQEEYEALAEEDFEVDIDALLELQKETDAIDGKSDGAGGMVAISSAQLGNVKAGANAVRVAQGIFVVARWALFSVQIVALANPVVIAGVLVAAAVGGAAVYYAKKKAAAAAAPRTKTWNGITKRVHCNENDYNRLRKRYKDACNSWSKCPAQTSCSVASAHITKAKACVAARKYFNQVCFNNVSDPGHDQVLRNAEQNITNCITQAQRACR